MSNIGRFLRNFAVALCLLDIVIPNTATALSGPSATSSPPSSGIPRSIQDDVCGTRCGQKPNIIIILADDMGWNDVSFHGSNQIPTPNIDALAYNGVILNNHYVPALCTPSRSALMTGKYPIHLGLQHSVIQCSEPRGLPLNEKLLPEYLKDVGYKTHAIGKWHLGFHKSDYLPINRGFESHYGYWNGLQDYYTHIAYCPVEPAVRFTGYDMRTNNEVNWDASGKYSTDLFTDEAVRLINAHNTSKPMFLYLAHLAPHSGLDDTPLQAPDEEVAKFSYIKDPERRVYAAMVSKLDQSVGDVMTALRKRKMLQNSVIVFLSDNGAPTSGLLANHGSNYPLRGIKESPWEGGMRGVAAVWSPLIKKPRRVSNQMFYMTDWLPTLLSAAGVENKDLPAIDGKDLWSTVVSDSISSRTEILLNIDDIDNYASIRRGDFKYVIGMTSKGKNWEGASGRQQYEKKEGFSPGYDVNHVLRSRAGIAIAGVATAKQIVEMKQRKERKRSIEENVSTDNLENQLLTARDILSMRKQATIECNVRNGDRIPCDPLKAPCLFDISKDPCEMRNLAENRPVTLSTLENALYKYRLTALQPANMDFDPLSNPALWNGTWTTWRDTKLRLSSIRQEIPPRTSMPIIIVIAMLVSLLSILGVVIGVAMNCNKNVPMNNTIVAEHDADSTGVASCRSKSVQSVQEYSTIKNISGDID